MKLILSKLGRTGVLLVFLSLCAFSSHAQKYVDASSLTIVGKLMPDTPNPYHRVDTVKFKGFTTLENFQVRMSSGISIAFRTNSKQVLTRAQFGKITYTSNTNAFSSRGFDMYIKEDGGWLWAGSAATSQGKESGQTLVIVENMDGQMKECILYLPTYSELYSLEIGIDEEAVIEPIDNPFSHRIGVFGSSFTHGSSTSRAGMTWPAQFSRSTGLQLLSLGCSGNSKLQPYFADVLAAADVDAFMFDAFSNPSANQIKERLFPFIEKIQAAKPGVPLIFIRTIYRENNNFNLKKKADLNNRIAVSDSLMAIAVKKYPDVYYVKANATSKTHESTVDGTHPDNYGYTLWAESIKKPVVKILKKYNISK